MSGARVEETRSGLAPFFVPLGIAAACLASLVWLAHPWFDVTLPGTADASMYLLCARSLAAGEGYSYLGMPFNMRPPGLSAILAPVIAWRGFDFHAINLVVGSFGAALVTLLFVVARPRVGTLLAGCIALFVWMSPAFRSMSNQAMSDVPGAALLLACLAIELRARSSPSWRCDLLLGLSIAAATYVRSVNLLVVPAIFASRWLAPRAQRLPGALAIAGIPILLLVPWLVRNARSHPPWPATQTAGATYASSFLNVDWGDPNSPRVALSDHLARIPGQIAETSAAIGRRLEPGPVRPLDIAAGAVVIVALLASVIRRRGAAEILALLVALELAVHPAFDERLVLPIALLGLVALVDLARELLTARIPARIAQGAVAVLLVALLVRNFDPRPNWARIEEDFRARRELAASWKAALPAEARLASNIGWHWSVFLERPVYSLFFAARRSGSAEGAEAVIDTYGIDTVILRVDPPEDPVFLNYFAQRYGAPAIAGKGAIFRVRP